VAVLGSGLDVIYPSEHEPLAADVAGHGALVSEYPPGTRPWPGNFPLRNRVISGLSRAVVIVEASNRSGSLITARMALEQGRQVLAVPGSVGSGCYQGCHALIKDGAGLVETVEDILDEVAGVGMHGLRPVKLLETHDLSSVIREGEAVGAEELAARTGRPVEQVLAELGRLEVDGLVSRGPGGTFIRSLTDLLPIDRGRT
jgi:DNA processing protein